MNIIMYRAVENVGREVLLIKDNKVVGEGFAAAMADGIVSIEMRDDRAKTLVENSTQVQAWVSSFPDKKYKWASFKFCSFTGTYLDTDEVFCEALEHIQVVDKFSLRYGMVPDSFKDTEGYRAAQQELNAVAK